MKWTPDVFWKLTIPEYVAALNGYMAVQAPKSKGKARRGLTSTEKNGLREMLEKDQRKNVSI